MQGKKTEGNPAKALILSIVIGLIICSLLLCLVAFILTSSKNIPQSLIEPITIVISAFSCFWAGYIFGKIEKKNGLLLGALVGFVIFALIFIIGYITVDNNVTFLSLIKGLGNTAFGGIGGVFGVNKHSKRR